ncbi:GlsB/YeaQ/YmgE family stress response membrane protein [Bacillus paramycoides]|uniref:GlsB/YeaQ/YmgE family stress response membrane protein n=1 Tax=Bacillus paramycoides TaxID=2026194 RepID=UPI002E1CE9C0|nr:GlsB/YeaQ/YmgE family stress response membrane protein [Bacillus paramycoides]MED1114257.1 GlsB/YeaQ/YmgE family stress response membrane protein [Bacillus paramycoides]
MIGTIAVSITGKDFPVRMFGNIIACLLGVWLGDELLYLVSFVRWCVYIGAIVLILIVSFIVKVTRR